MPIRRLISTSQSKLEYYASMNETFRQIYGKTIMLHYPFHKSSTDSLEQRQMNLTEHLLEKGGGIDGLRVLEVGCGNGSQSLYMAERHNPVKVTGIDLIPANIQIAMGQHVNGHPVEFNVDDAQQLQTIPSGSIDFLICVESALHYPQKELFIKQVKRVLKPGGRFVIADIVNKYAGRKYPSASWKEKMVYFHWTVDEYKTAFREQGLELTYEEDLTANVIKGYDNYGRWVSREVTKSFYKYILFRIFATIHCEINIRNLKKKENYYLFVGTGN